MSEPPDKSESNKSWQDDWKCLLATLSIAAICGLLFRLLGMPAPFMLGSMLGVWFLTASFRPLRPLMRIPRWFHVFVVLGVGVIVGAMFGHETIGQMLDWIYTVSAMLIASVVATAAGFWYLSRRRGYEPSLALFCALPGGQAEVILLSREFVDKDYVVALCHLVRVVFIFLSVPLGLALIMGESAVQSSNRLLSELPSVVDLSPLKLLQFIAVALAGYAGARLLRTPVPFLLGPMLLSVILHLTDVIDIPRISEFVFIAQIAVGGMVGARLGKVEFRVLAGYLRDALVNVVLVTSIFVIAAYLIASWVGLDFINVMLAFVPGGLYEITLLSLIFGFDVAFVAVHHATRMVSLLFALPWLLKLLRAKAAD